MSCFVGTHSTFLNKAATVIGIYVILNANKELRTVNIPKGQYTIVCANGEVNEAGLGQMEGGEVMVDGQSALILHN